MNDQTCCDKCWAHADSQHRKQCNGTCVCHSKKEQSSYHQRFREKFFKDAHNQKVVEHILAFIDIVVKYERVITSAEGRNEGRDEEPAALIEKVKGMKLSSDKAYSPQETMRPLMEIDMHKVRGFGYNGALDDLLTYLRGEDNQPEA